MERCLLKKLNTGQFTWIKSKGISKTIVGEIAGTKIVKNYISIVFNQKSYLAHRLAWLYVHGEFPKNLIDHIDKDKTNNRIDNLREATHAENMQNIGTFSKNNTCNALGVSKKRKKFSASICINRKKISLGSFNTIELAHEAYLTAKRKYHSFCTI